MANILGRLTVNNTKILSVDSDPSAGLGTVGEIGDVAVDVSSGKFFQNTDGTNTGWVFLTNNNDSISNALIFG